MNAIDLSLMAIEINVSKGSRPQEGFYLEVQGEGKEQRLACVKNSNWWGRLWTWFGCTCFPFSMVKVAKFLERNMQALCASSHINLQDDQNPLVVLVERIKKYNRNHDGRISFQAANIIRIYEAARVQRLVPSPLIVNPQPVTPNPKHPAVMPAPAAVPPQQPAVAKTPNLGGPVLSIPIVPAPSTPALAPAAAIQQCVDRFKAARGHIKKVVNLLNPSQTPPKMVDILKASAEMKALKQLLKDCENFPDCLAAIIREMPPEEVGMYVSFALSPKKAMYSNGAEDIFQDIFEINSGNRFQPTQIFTTAVTHMSVDQFKFVIGALKFGNAPQAEDAFYNLAELICKRPAKDQLILFGRMIKCKIYLNTIDPNTIKLRNSPGQPAAQTTVDNVLAEFHMLHLLRDPQYKIDLPKRRQHIYDLLKSRMMYAQQFGCASFENNTVFLNKLTVTELDDLAVALAKNATTGAELVGSILMSDPVLVVGQNRSKRMFGAIIKYNLANSSELCAALRKLQPNCDEDFLIELLQTGDEDTLKKYIQTGLPDSNSILEDSAFKKIPKISRMFLCRNILETVDPQKWNAFSYIHEMMSKSLSATKVYKFFRSIPSFDRNLLLAYCKEQGVLTGQQVLKAIVAIMDLNEIESWKEFQMNQFTATMAYQAMSKKDQLEAYNAYYKTL